MYERLRPFLFSLDAERAHGLGVMAARLGQAVTPGMVEKMYAFEHDALRQTTGADLPNDPVRWAVWVAENRRGALFR